MKVRGARLVVGMLAAGLMSVSAAAVLAAGGGDNWSSAGHDVRNTRYTSTEHDIGTGNVGGLVEQWVLHTVGDVSATPAVDDTTVYVPDFAGNLYAIDRATGAVRWQKSLSADYGLPPGDHARATPAIAGNLLIFGDQSGKLGPTVNQGNILAVDKRTGALAWRTAFTDVAPIVTQSAVVQGTTAYVGVASYEEVWARFLPPEGCCFFRGSVMALDVRTGAIKWKTYTAPAPTGAANDGYTGNAVWGSTAAIDSKRGQLYVATGNNYSVPASVTACVLANPDNAAACIDPSNHFDSILALDLTTGAIRWATKALPFDAWNVSCGLPIPGFDDETENCPEGHGPDFDFGQGPALFTVRDARGKVRDLVGAGQKSGRYWALDPATGAVVWSTQVSPGGLTGGLQWGSATDGTRVYVANSNSGFAPWVLQNGSTVNYGGWSALDAATGQILWETPNPGFAQAMGPVSAANGVVYGCSLDSNGHQIAMNAATGAILWDHPSGAACLGGAAISNGQVFWGTGYDLLTLPDDDQALWAFKLPG